MSPHLLGCLGQKSVHRGRAPAIKLAMEWVRMNDTTTERWLSVEEIAEYLGIKKDTVYKWIDRKQMPAHKVGSLWKFKRDEIDAWVRSGDAGGPPNTYKPR